MKGDVPFARHIQRFPAGLLNVLQIAAGGSTPQQLSEQVVGTIDLLQFYGLTQRQVLQGSNAAAAQGAVVSVASNGTALPTDAWCLLFGAYANTTKAAAMTDLEISIAIRRGGGLYTFVATKEAARVGVAGGVTYVPFVAPYPLLLPPGSDVAVVLTTLVGVATAPVSIGVDVGVLG